MNPEKFYDDANRLAEKYEQIIIDLHKQYTLGIRAYNQKMILQFSDEKGDYAGFVHAGPLNGLDMEQKRNVMRYVSELSNISLK